MKPTTSKSILLFALAASTAFVVEAESSRNLNARIVGGDQVAPGQYPFFGKRKPSMRVDKVLSCLQVRPSRQVAVIESDSFV